MKNTTNGNGIHIQNGFIPNHTRYEFDTIFKAKDGWSQLDTSEDASYYGNWINRELKMIVSFAEGDYNCTVCDNDKVFVKVLTERLQWLVKQGYEPRIDDFGNEETYSDFSDYL